MTDKWNIPDDLSGLDDIPPRAVELDVSNNGLSLFMAFTLSSGAELFVTNLIRESAETLQEQGVPDDVTVYMDGRIMTTSIIGEEAVRHVQVTFKVGDPHNTWMVSVGAGESCSDEECDHR